VGDFPTSYIDLSYFNDFWGPFTFEFKRASSEGAGDGILPYGAVISAVNVRVFKGRVTRRSDLSQETEITDLLDPDFPPVLSDNTVTVRFQYGDGSAKGSKCTIIFELTLDSGAKAPIYFHYLRVN